jgi:hypothetical protein
MRNAQSIEGVAIEELLALAEGRLTGQRRADAEARVAASARAAEALGAQRRAIAALRAFAPATPPGLEARIRTRAASRPGRVRLYRPGLAGACAALALALVAGLALNGGGDTLAEAAAISEKPATEPPPASAGRSALRRSFAGVTFPQWDREFEWRATGARRASADGRATDTVYYVHAHHRIGYTVLSGRPVGLPSRGHRVVRRGVPVQIYRDGPATVAVFERNGRTCVLAGVVHRESTLVKLASWRADGSLSF